MTELPPIPRDLTRLNFHEPRFITYEGTWMLIGPDTDLKTGETVTVTTFGAQRPVSVVVGECIAQRTVIHRHGSYSEQQHGHTTRYVVARITNTVGHHETTLTICRQ